ncbi:MAG: ABC transporter permease [Ruminococcus sp.]|nr:ABC transporter permease [Ruminococcus sp.]
MYIIKNALRCISRSKGRNILIGIIVLVIATSCCIGLSIRQAAESARSDALDNLSVTATISFDRQSMMNDMRGDRAEGGAMQGEASGERPQFDRDQFQQMMGGASALSLDEYLTYAEAESVKDFYYTLTASMNGSDSLEPVSTDTSSDASTNADADNMQGIQGDMPQGGFGGGKGMMSNVSQGDFTLVGYSSDSAMTSFIDGTATITAGTVFNEGTSEYDCIISEELSAYNSIATGDEITIINPNNESEVYALTVVGIYSDSSANENSFGPMGFSSSDPANKIYMSYTALESIVSASSQVSETITDETTGRTYESAVTGTLSGTYVFDDADSYYLFEEEVRDLGLDDTYTVSSSDITSFENSLTPLNTLSKMAGWFLLVILIIGAVILIVLNIFSVRERKYEIGVLTAMGMKKGKVALQFMTELFTITVIAVIIGVIIGGVCAVPVTNALLESQITSQQNRNDMVEQNFGRPGNMQGMGDIERPNNNMDANADFDKAERPSGGIVGDMFSQGADYITEINSAMNFTVVLQMLLIALLLTIISGAASMLFIMRYEPLKILANRD